MGYFPRRVSRQRTLDAATKVLLPFVIVAAVPVTGLARTEGGSLEPVTSIAHLTQVNLAQEGGWNLAYGLYRKKPSAGFNLSPARANEQMDAHVLTGRYSYSSQFSMQVSVNMLEHTRYNAPVYPGYHHNRYPAGEAAYRLGTTEFAASFRFNENHHQSWQAALGINLPMGRSVGLGQYAADPAPDSGRNYDYGLTPSLTYLRQVGWWEMGARGAYTLRVSDSEARENSANRVDLAGWLKTGISRRTQAKLGIMYASWENGLSDEALSLSPDYLEQSVPGDIGATLDLSFGVSHEFRNGHQVGINYATPLVQQYNGVESEDDTTNYNLIWQYQFQ
jgi:hypothetical protein